MNNIQRMNELNVRLNDLENENKYLHSKLLEVNDKLKESEKLKSNFISNVMNEMVNPFSSIISLSENIMYLKSGDIDKAIKKASLIKKEAFNIDFQLNNIFMAAKLEAGDTHPANRKINVRNLLKNLLDDYRFILNEKKMEVNVDYNIANDPILTTDSEKLKLILNNLLNNAIRFSGDKTKVQISIKRSDEKLMFAFKDEGKGIPKEEIKKIFERFKQLDSGINNLNPGQGLGLSIVKALADILSGEISLESIAGKGSSFMFTIPAQAKSDAPDIEDGDAFLFDSEEF